MKGGARKRGRPMTRAERDAIRANLQEFRDTKGLSAKWWAVLNNVILMADEADRLEAKIERVRTKFAHAREVRSWTLATAAVAILDETEDEK
jgi:hypothetical protein